MLSCNTFQTGHTNYTAALKTTTHLQTGKTVWSNLTSNAPDVGRMYPKQVELWTSINFIVASSWHFILFHRQKNLVCSAVACKQRRGAEKNFIGIRTEIELLFHGRKLSNFVESKLLLPSLSLHLSLSLSHAGLFTCNYISAAVDCLEIRTGTDYLFNFSDRNC